MYILYYITDNNMYLAWVYWTPDQVIVLYCEISRLAEKNRQILVRCLYKIINRKIII